MKILVNFPRINSYHLSSNSFIIMRLMKLVGITLKHPNFLKNRFYLMSLKSVMKVLFMNGFTYF